MDSELTVDTSALIISQDTFPNNMLFHSLYLVTLLLPRPCLVAQPTVLSL